MQLLSSLFDSEDDARDALIYSYKHSFSGFAAKLNSTQAATLSGYDEVVSVFKSRLLKIHTTRSWDFMGLALDHQKETPMQIEYCEDIVVGVFDTGIWPESDSFKETPYMEPVPSQWRGVCVAGEQFNHTACNKKLIGARFYINGYESQVGPLNTTKNLEYRSPRDHVGHGTHTASIAVGVPVANASFLGLARGLARGGAPMARLAVYKICWNPGFCAEADILAAFDDAIVDGVHVISASLGTPAPLPGFFASSSDIGSFHAAQRNIVVVFSAGNVGPEPTLVQNVPPWSICVAATTIDRIFPTELVLGNNKTIMGEGLAVEQMKLPLVEGEASSTSGTCDINQLKEKEIRGKAVLCFSTMGSTVSSTTAAIAVYLAGGSALIFADSPTRQEAQVSLLPTIFVDISQGTQILSYIQTSRAPTMQIGQTRTSVGRVPAPTVAYFSSRGPSSIAPNILKPDISAPGVNILAAWPTNLPPSSLPVDHNRVKWNLMSGTSMACPHVAGVVALLRAAHPTWSTAAIKSALMTTAYTVDTSLDKILGGGVTKPADPFDAGAGHVNPLAALDPGLVYDVETSDYISFLCGMGYSEQQIRKIISLPPGTNATCPAYPVDTADLNYPAIVVSNLQSTTTVRRTLRNVGWSNAIYFASVVNPEGVEVMVWPRMMSFTKYIEKISYHVTLTPLKNSKGRYDLGEIVWFDGYHHVRTPLVVCVNNTMNIDDVDPSRHQSI
ncbi:subtilisin-like protease SBT3.18 [Nymphaea colorata]|nr:subtilisin-like protease SBT3.18 [Nymphaea colorata]XP_049932419.1 subtilisin-like protease SBT3.18 [Nymphaea colorata]